MKYALFVPLLFLPACAGYVPGRQAQWDDEVKRLCMKDGGVRVFETLRVSKKDIEFLERVDGKIAVPNRQTAHPAAPAYSELTVTSLKRDGGIHMWRAESVIKRRRDEVVIARWVTYTRSGGDFPSPLHESSFTCPDPKEINNYLQRLFIIEPGRE